MKMMKKIAGLVLAICLLVPCFSILTFAADGAIEFSDHVSESDAISVGETVKVTCALKLSSGGEIQDSTVVISYDASALKFLGDPNVTETTEGELTCVLDVSATNKKRADIELSFKGLKEGTTKVEVVRYEARTASQDINCREGYSSIKVLPGELTEDPVDEPTIPPTDAVTVVMDGNTYFVSNEYKESDIPNGYEETTIAYESGEIKALRNAASNVVLVSLAEQSGEAELYLFDEATATFSAYREISISVSTGTTIVILTNTDEAVIPRGYLETIAEIDSVQFPAWQNPDHSETCILYAVNNMGEKGFYQYDIKEGTYQRFVSVQVAEDDSDDGMFARVLNDNMDVIFIMIAAVFVIMLVVLIVLSVKLFNRNAELDELYDEYGIDLDEEGTIVRNDEEEEFFIRIDDEQEETQWVPMTEDVDVDVDVDVDADEDVEEEIFDSAADLDELEKRQVVTPTPSIKEDIDVIAKYLSDDKKTSLFEDDDDDDFEMDFIDLDD